MPYTIATSQGIPTKQHMKSIIKLILICLGILVNPSCTTEEESGSVAFYTHIQALTNCGDFDVDIYINGELKGKLDRPILPIDSIPDCNSIDPLSILIVDLPVGVYDYDAQATCSEDLNESGEFSIVKNGCTVVNALEIGSK